MPIYEYKCSKCGKEKEELSRKYEPVKKRPCCNKSCEGILKLQISLPAEHDATLGYPYVSQNIAHTPTRVEGRVHKKALLKKNNLYDAGPAMRFGGNF